MFTFLKRHKGLLFLTLVFTLIFITNFKANTYLLGWDSLQTELNPVLGIKRALFSSWQEFQSFGLVAGMAHAADLLRAIVIYLLSFVLPASIIRYVFTMGMIFGGTLGVYYLFRHLFKASQIKYLAFIGALFYLLNFNLIQMFFLPFEAFSVFAAVLPWNVLVFVKTLENGLTKRNLAQFIGLSILSTPAFVAQQLFVVLISIFGCLTLGLAIQKRSFTPFLRASALVSIMGILNLFWILPQIYFLLDNGSITKTSKISQLSTIDVFYRNLDKGNIWDFLSNTGFFYDSNGLNQQPLFAVWKAYREFPFIQFFIYGISLVTIFGIFKKSPYRWPFLFCLVLVSIALLNNTPLIRETNDLLRSNSFINQMFRNPFTKFSLVYALISSYFFCVGLSALSRMVKKIHMHYVVLGIGVFFILMQSFPALFGQYVSREMKVAIPSEYHSMFKFFNKVDKNKRIALLPDYTYWGWYYQDWGYNGSGFLWYGIEQPIISRNFDMWSSKSESYFWEAKGALEGEDVAAYNNVLKKYDVGYIVLDESASPVITSMKAIQYDRLKKVLSESENIKLEKKWGVLSVYKVTQDSPKDDFISYTTQLSNIGPEILATSRDTAYSQNAEYETDPSKPYDKYYPFLDLTTQTKITDKTWEIHESDGGFQFVKHLDFDLKDYKLSTSSGTFDANLYINNIPVSYSLPYTVSYTKNQVVVQFPKALLKEFGPHESKVTYCWNDNGKLTSKKTNASLTINASKGATGCLEYNLGSIDQRYGYLLTINNKNIEGQRLFFYVVDQTKSQPYVEDRLTQDSHYYILANRYREGVGYSFSFQANSLKTVPSVNQLNRMAIYIIPYDILKNVSFTKKGYSKKETISYLGSSHKVNYYTYITTPPQPTGDKTLVLSQAYDAGWKAYEVKNSNWFTTTFPFLTGKEITSHVLIDNWENGWNIKNYKGKITIVFLPQFLEYIGLLTAGIFLVGLSTTLIISKVWGKKIASKLHGE